MYKYWNINPLNKKLPDCVCRAISLATRTDYNMVMDMLLDNGVCYECDELTVDCYSKMISEIGYQEVEGDNKTVADISKEHPDNILLIRIEGHLTCSINGCIYDIWDCSDKTVDKYWVVT